MNKTEGWWSGKTIKSFLGYVRILFFNINKIRIIIFRKHINEQVLFMK